MRVKILRRNDSGTVLLVYPSTLDEHRQVLTLGRGVRPAAGHDELAVGRTASGPPQGCYVVTTEEQRRRWGLPDLAACGRARMVNESQALELLHEPAAWSAAAELPAAAEVVSAPSDAGPDTSGLAAVREIIASGPRVDRVLAALESGVPPPLVCETLRRALLQSIESGKEAVEETLARAAMAVALPWRTRGPVQFDPAHLKEALNRTHGGLDRVKTQLIEVLAANPQLRGALTVEAPRRGEDVETASSAVVVLPRTCGAAARIPCLVGPPGSGKTSLAVAVAEALGRAHVRAALDEHHTEHVIRGKEGNAPGCIVRGLREAGVRNPAFILELLDEVKPEVAGALLDVLEPVVGKLFQDRYLQLPFDLSSVLWIVTAADPKAIPEQMRKRLEVIELPGYTEQEKLVIAEQYLLKRRLDAALPVSVGCLAPEPAASSSIVTPDTGSAGPVVVGEREVSSMAELEALSAGLPFPTADAWRTAASEGVVRFESEAIRQVIRDHTDEAGLTQLHAKLAVICRQAIKRRPPGDAGTEVITPAVVRDVLGEVDALPAAVCAAIARERRRVADKSDGDAKPTSPWIEWLQQLPWTRSGTAPIDLARVRAALDAGHAGLGHAKARILEYLAVRRRNPLGTGAVICFLGPPGVGKTSLAQCTARALGRGFVKLSCGGLHDETDLRGHNRTWRDAQPGSILREMRRVGSNDPVFVLDEIDKLGPAPAAVLLEVLDPEQNDRFRDSFIELPFDLSAVLFITTANEVARIPPALRDRLEIIDLPGYTETEKVAIAETHLIPAQNRAAGLTAAPVRFTRGACRRMIRDYTHERGIRQLTRCLQTVCRKVALGLETGDAALVRNRITAAQVHTFLGAPSVDRTDGLDRLREQVDAPGVPDVVRERGREVLGRLAAWPRTDPEHAKQREYLRCLASLPWTKRTAAPLDLARARAVLDTGHAGHGAVKERLVDYIAVRLTKPEATAPLLCLVGPAGVGKTSLARLLAAALGRARAWVVCGELTGAAAVHGTVLGPPGRIVEELLRVGVRNPMFVLDEVDRLDEGSGAAAALLEAIAPAPGAAFRDRHVDVPFDLSESLFVATANGLGSVPTVLRETMTVLELPGYTDAEKQFIAKGHLLPWQLACHGLTADQVRVTDEAIEAMIGGYTRGAGVWDLADALGTVCAKVVRRRAEGDEAPVEVTPETLAGILGPPSHRKAEVAARAGRPGVAVGLSLGKMVGGGVLVVEVGRMPGTGALTLTGGLGQVMRESARVALSWVRSNAARYGIDPSFHRGTDIHVHVQSPAVRKDGASAGVAIVAAMVSALTGRAVRGDLAMTGEITLSGKVLPVAGIREKVLAAYRCGLARVILPQENETQVDEELGDLRRAVEVHYVAQVEDLLDWALRRPASSAATLAGPAP